MLPATLHSKNIAGKVSGSSALCAGRLTEMPYPSKLKLTFEQPTVHRVP